MFKVLSRAIHTLIKNYCKKIGFFSVCIFFFFLINISFYLGQNSSCCYQMGFGRGTIKLRILLKMSHILAQSDTVGSILNGSKFGHLRDVFYSFLQKS